jgi:hypothetical protein
MLIKIYDATSESEKRYSFFESIGIEKEAV